MSFILSFFFLIIGIVFLGILFLAGFLRNIFSGGKHKASYSGTSNEDNGSNRNFYAEKHKSKVFDKSEGEYVDFEEVK